MQLQSPPPTCLEEKDEAALHPLCFHFEIFHQVVLREQTPELGGGGKKSRELGVDRLAGSDYTIRQYRILRQFQGVQAIDLAKS